MRRLAVVLAVGLLVACSDDDDAGPTPTTREDTSTSIVDYTGVVLPGVGGETTTTIEEKGTARLVGSVVGPAGPLAGATVRVDRLVGDREIRHDVLTAADGRWELRDVPGGRYRVRAFQAPSYAQTTAEIRFLADGEEHRFDLQVEDQRGIIVQADAAPDPPRVDGPVNLAVVVVQRTVGNDGIVRSEPLAGAFVELIGLGRWEPLGDDAPVDPSSTTTSTTFDDGTATSVGAVLSASGRADFELRCRSAGAPGLSLRIPVVRVPDPGPPTSGTTTTTTAPVPTTEDVAVEPPACVEAPTTTTTTTSTSSTP